jgi:hypothetical protein
MAAATACIYKNSEHIYMLFLATYPILYVWEATSAFLPPFPLLYVLEATTIFCQLFSPLLSSPLSFANNKIVQL